MSHSDQPQTTDQDDQEQLTDQQIVERARQMDAFPEAEDYDPDANHQARIQGGMAPDDDTWNEFGIALRPLLVDGHDIGKRVLMRNGKPLEVVSDRYKVLPHERLAVVADEIADELGMVKWDQFDGDWYIEMDQHIIMDDDGRRMHALYAQPDPVEIGDDDDEIHIGFAVHNSIDSSLGFNVGLFTFRHACANMVWMGVNGDGMGFDDRDVVAHYGHKHTKGLNVEYDTLKAQIEQTLYHADTVSEAYRNWREEYVSVEDALALLEEAESGRLADSDLPEWLQTAQEQLENARENVAENESISEENQDELSQEATEGIVRQNLPGTETRWQTYNGLTAEIWHSDSTQDTSKQRKMKAVHNVFQPDAGGDVEIR